MLSLLFAAAAAFPPPPSVSERDLAAAINGYRRTQGLPAVRLSPSLTTVSRAHVWDLETNRPDDATGFGQGRCNMHSWSRAGWWRPVCYTHDNAQATAMWSKPREVTRGGYTGEGFEIAFWWSGDVTPAQALEGWIHSAGHEQVISEHGVWRDARWQAMGVAIGDHYAVAWFGKEPDPVLEPERMAQVRRR